MGKFCDRSPCTPLMEALGHYIFGSPEGFVLTVAKRPEVPTQEEIADIDIEYCPFCGTRLDEVPQIQLEKFTKPRRRRAMTLPRGSI
jgi:hypothetical protein